MAEPEHFSQKGGAVGTKPPLAAGPFIRPIVPRVLD